jgi:hypothetical protein
MVWEFLPFTKIKKDDRKFKDLEVGRAIIMKDYTEDGKPIARVGYIRRFELNYIIVFVPSINCECIVEFDGVNYFISRH